MTDDATTITLAPDDLSAFRAAVIACAGPADHERCERLLGQLASLEARANHTMLRFIPSRETRTLARRAVAHLEHARRRPGTRQRTGP